MGRAERACLWLSAAAGAWGMGRTVAAAEPSGAQVLRRRLLSDEEAASGWSGSWRPLGDLVDRLAGAGGHDLWTAATFLAGALVAGLLAARVASATEPPRGASPWRRGAPWLAAATVVGLLPWGWLLGSGTGLADLLAVGLALLAGRWAGSWRGPAACAAALGMGELGLLAPVFLHLEALRRPRGEARAALGWAVAAVWLLLRAWRLPDPWGDGAPALAAAALPGGRAVLGALALAGALALFAAPRRPVLLGGALLATATLAVVAGLTAGGSVAPIACGAVAVAAGTLGLAAASPLRFTLAVAGVAACATLSWPESELLVEDRAQQVAYAIRAAAETGHLPGSLPLLDSTWPPSRLATLGIPAGQAAYADWFGAARPVWPLRTRGEPRPYVRRPNAIGVDPEGAARVVPAAVWSSATPARLRLSEPESVEVLGSFPGRRLDALLWTSEGYAAARGPAWEAMGTGTGPGGVELPRFALDVDALLGLEGGALRAQLREARRAGARHAYLELRWVDDARGIAHRPIAATDWIELAWDGRGSTRGPASP